jgi:hypothetical protein
MSRGWKDGQRWVVMPGRARLAVVVTSSGPLQRGSNSQRLAADVWLSTAPGPQANTAAAARETGSFRRGPMQ